MIPILFDVTCIGSWIAYIKLGDLSDIISRYDMLYTVGGRSHWLPSAARRKSDTPLTYGDDSSHPIAIHYLLLLDFILSALWVLYSQPIISNFSLLFHEFLSISGFLHCNSTGNFPNLPLSLVLSQTAWIQCHLIALNDGAGGTWWGSWADSFAWASKSESGVRKSARWG